MIRPLSAAALVELGASLPAARFAAWVAERFGRLGVCSLRQTELAADWVADVDTVRRYERELRRIGAWRSLEVPGRRRRVVVLLGLDATRALVPAGEAGLHGRCEVDGRPVDLGAARSLSRSSGAPRSSAGVTGREGGRVGVPGPPFPDRAALPGQVVHNRAPLHGQETPDRAALPGPEWSDRAGLPGLGPCRAARFSTSSRRSNYPPQPSAECVDGRGGDSLGWAARALAAHGVRIASASAVARVVAWAEAFVEPERVLAAAAKAASSGRDPGALLVHRVDAGRAEEWLEEADRASGPHDERLARRRAEPAAGEWDQDLERIALDLRSATPAARALAERDARRRFGSVAEAREALAAMVEGLPEGAHVETRIRGGLDTWRGAVARFRAASAAVHDEGPELREVACG